ncbi:helix-turn-helix domain-containing protein [Paenibacillus allorhizosphaerae]|uniref:HTH-type transcriptional regulator YesS n=1 Tax=Paenibacillus allorhizosphaerae TaxID=2849866 RepID=A0ABN7THN8_9BACL|nr:helix-turn-helix domain-containing protein [Paenibacillus allorhizosphaerae]CAG7628874.1 HTH-type transcriptional regulator YesS [Paenibacillus allorhizosphaerae]
MQIKRTRKFANMTFQRKLLFYSLCLSIFPVLTIGLLSSYIASRSMQNVVDQNHRYMLNQMQVQLGQLTKNLEIASIYIATNLAVEKSVREGPGIDKLNASLEMNETIRRIRSTSSIRYNVSIIYKRFNNFIYSNEYSSDKIEQMRLVSILEKMMPLMNESFVVPANTFDDQPDLLLFRPVPINSGYGDGVLVLHVSPDDILRFVGSTEHGRGTRVLVADEKGKIVLSSKQGEMGRSLNEVVPAVSRESGDFMRTLEIGGKSFKVQVQKSAQNDWTYIAMTPMSELTAQSDRIRLSTWIIAGVLLLGWSIIAAALSRRMYYPIRRLTDRHMPLSRNEKSLGDGLARLGTYLEQLADANRQLNDRLNEQFPYLRQGIFQQLLRGEMSERELLLAAEYAQINLKGSYVFVLVAEADDIPAFHHMYREKDRALIHYALPKLMEETFRTVPFCLGFTPKTGRIILLIGMDDAGEEAKALLRRYADEARASVRSYFRFPVSVAIGSPLPGFTEIGKGYDEAAALLGHRFILGGDITIGAEQADEALLRLNRQTVERQKRIVHHVLHGNLVDSRKLLAEIAAELSRTPIRPQTAMGLFAYMLGELDYMLQQTGCDIQEAIGIDFYGKLHDLRTLPELERWLAGDLFPAVKAHLERESVSKQAKTVSEVIRYVQEHISEEMSLQKAADRFGLSVSYLSKLFKDESGFNFSEYVLELRMNKAREWLEHTDLPIKHIAERSGYASVQNFNRVFKRRYNLPPGEYRREKRQA